MQRFLVILFISLFAFSSFSESSYASGKKKHVVYVYMSVSKSAKCYHASPKCKALRKSRKIVKLTLSEAEKNKKACKHCYYPASPIQNRDYPLNSPI